MTWVRQMIGVGELPHAGTVNLIWQDRHWVPMAVGVPSLAAYVGADRIMKRLQLNLARLCSCSGHGGRAYLRASVASLCRRRPRISGSSTRSMGTRARHHWEVAVAALVVGMFGISQIGHQSAAWSTNKPEALDLLALQASRSRSG